MSTHNEISEHKQWICKAGVIAFLKKETVLVVATVLAVISAFFVKPSIRYLDYIDWRVLVILWSLMTVMAGFQENGFFKLIGEKLLCRTKSAMQLSVVLVFLCFFFSMLITNDVALLTFVPFAIIILEESRQERLLIPVIILQTLAANLGSMLTPIGNPQNLYLYNLMQVPLGQFVGYMLPYTLTSGVLLMAGIFIFCRSSDSVCMERQEQKRRSFLFMERKNMIYMLLFLVCLLVVARVLPYYVAALIVLIVVLCMERKVLVKVDYCLLLTFISFFIFTGNMGNIPPVRQTLQSLVGGRELETGILASQFISNVPAALLLSDFAGDTRELLTGVNLGGLGTLIASMASLISYKLFAHRYNEKKGRYLAWFTIANIVFLIILILVHAIS